MNLMGVVPFFIRIPTPCTSIPRSFASAHDHITFAGVCMRFLYACTFPVTESMIELHCSVSNSLFIYSSVLACLCVLAMITSAESHLSLAGALNSRVG